MYTLAETYKDINIYYRAVFGEAWISGFDFCVCEDHQDGTEWFFSSSRCGDWKTCRLCVLFWFMMILGDSQVEILYWCVCGGVFWGTFVCVRVWTSCVFTRTKTIDRNRQTLANRVWVPYWNTSAPSHHFFFFFFNTKKSVSSITSCSMLPHSQCHMF